MGFNSAFKGLKSCAMRLIRSKKCLSESQDLPKNRLKFTRF